MTTVAVNRPLESLEYRFSLERLEELNRTPAPLLLARLNTACPSYGKTSADAADPEALIEEIRNHCAGDENFIRNSLPLQEIVFRTLLLNGGEPMTLGELHREVTEHWSTPIRAITVTVAGLARVLDSDVFYGFALASPVEPEPATPEPPPPTLSATNAGATPSLNEIITAMAADGMDDDDDDDDDLYEDYDEEEDDFGDEDDE